LVNLRGLETKDGSDWSSAGLPPIFALANAMSDSRVMWRSNRPYMRSMGVEWYAVGVFLEAWDVL